MPTYRCTWSIDKFTKPAHSSNGEIQKIEANNETHVAEIVRERIAVIEKVDKEKVYVTGVTRVR